MSTQNSQRSSITKKCSKFSSVRKKSTASAKDLNIFGKFKKHNISSSKENNATNLVTVIASASESRGSSKKVQNPTTTIEETDKSQSTLLEKRADDQSSSILTQPLKDGILFAVVLPYILDEDKGVIKQPLVVKLNESNLLDFGFQLPFSKFTDKRLNCFKIKIGSHQFYSQIIATGDSPLNLKVSLNENTTSNKCWQKLPKIKRLSKGVTKLIHCPLDSENDVPSQRVLTSLQIKKLLESDEIIDKAHLKDKPDQRNDQPNSQRSSKPLSNSFLTDSEYESDQSSDHLETKTKDHKKSLKINNSNENGVAKDDESSENRAKKRKVDNVCLDKSVADVSIESINDQVTDLLKRKKNLSEYDTIGSFLISIINVIDEMRKYIDHNNQSDSEISNVVPERDCTYKSSNKNQIYVEGVIRFDLDLYDEAIRNSTPSLAPSFAYQLVKIAFPKNYYENVTLGKKFLDKKDLEGYLTIDKSKKFKYPLSFIWGFEKPFTARMEGDFNYKLGQERVRAFMNHVFRKAKIYKYSAAAEYKVRSRMVKELCARNAELTRKSIIDDNDDDNNIDDDGSRYISEENDKETTSYNKDKDSIDPNLSDQENSQDSSHSTWNSECFDF